MLYGYLIGIVIMAVMVLSALRPPRRPLSVARVSYFAGVMINQVPLLFLALLTWSTADAVFSGGLLNAAAGWIMSAGGLLVASALVYLQVRATRARPAIFAALASIAPDEPLRPTTSLWRARLPPSLCARARSSGSRICSTLRAAEAIDSISIDGATWWRRRRPSAVCMAGAIRSRHPLRVVGELTDWFGHSPEQIRTMRDNLARLAAAGAAHIED